MSNYIILIISFINATIFFFSFLGKNKKTRIRTKFHILYLINSTSLLAYTLIKSIHLLNICLSIIVLITFQLSLLLLYEIIRIYLGIKERKLAKFLYFISAGLSFLVLTAYTTNLVNLKFALLLFEFFNFTILIYTFIITISTLLANPHYINSYSILCMIALLYSIILSPGIILTSYNSGLYLQPIILGSLLYILYFYDVSRENISNTNSSLASEFNLISSSVVLIDIDGKLLEYNTSHIKLFKNFADNKIDFFNYFEFIKCILNLDGLDELKYNIKQVIEKKETVYYVKRFLHKKKHYTYTIEISPVITKDSTNIMLVFTEGEHILLLEKDENTLLSSKFETLGELADSVISDINTPITNIKTNLSILKTDKDISKEDIEFIDMIDSSASKINILTTSIRNHFRNTSHYKNESFDLLNILINIEALTRKEFKNANCSLVLDTPDSLMVYGIPSKLSQVFLNIINNSINAYKLSDRKDNRKIIIKVSSSQKNVSILIKDFAGGIKKDIQPHIFNNILTTHGTNGFGLGLYVSNNIIKEDFGGKISFNVKENESTSIKITIPTNK